MATAQTGWIGAAIGIPGAIVVAVAVTVALARVLIAGAFPGGEKLRLERRLAVLAYGSGLLGAAVIVVRFAQLAK